MKTIISILITLFLSASIFMGIAAVKNFSSTPASETEKQTEVINGQTMERQALDVKDDIDAAENETTGLSAEKTLKELPDEDIFKKPNIKFFLDGTKENGIYLGTAGYGVESREVAKLFGEEYLNTGFILEWNRESYVFEPGSTHYLYMYIETPDGEETYIRNEIQIQGDLQTHDNINLYIEFPKESEIDKDRVSFSGWAVDISSNNGTNIDRIEFYLDGPRGFGKMLGTAEYGFKREDVANSFGNNNFLNSGFRFNADVSQLEPGSVHSIYIYTVSNSGAFNLMIKDIKIEGEEKEKPGANIYIKSSLEDDPEQASVMVTGWIIDIDYEIQRIVFVSDIYGNEDIFSMKLDGSDLKQLTDAPGADLYPAISSDGRRILYSSDINGVWQIMVMNWDGSGKKQLTFNPERNGDPSWSFDDQFVYFERFLEENWELYKMRIDGSDVKRLTTNPMNDDWHPYGHATEYKILYEAGIPGNFDIFIMNDDGSNTEKITAYAFEKRVPSMSRDGKYIVFQGKTKGGRYSDIYLVNEKGDDLKKLTEGKGQNGHAIISPDNQYVVYENEQDGKKQIFLMNLDGSNKKQLTLNPDFKSSMPDFIFIK